MGDNALCTTCGHQRAVHRFGEGSCTANICTCEELTQEVPPTDRWSEGTLSVEPVAGLPTPPASIVAMSVGCTCDLEWDGDHAPRCNYGQPVAVKVQAWQEMAARVAALEQQTIDPDAVYMVEQLQRQRNDWVTRASTYARERDDALARVAALEQAARDYLDAAGAPINKARLAEDLDGVERLRMRLRAAIDDTDRGEAGP
jgi:hypothetical protein